MKVKVDSENFKKLATSILPFSGGAVLASSGVIGLLFTETMITIRAFNETWAWGDIPCETIGFTDDIFFPIRDSAIRIILLHCKGESVSIRVSPDRIIVGSTAINSLNEWSEGDLMPKIDMANAHWLLLPPQVAEVMRVSLTCSNGWHKSSALYLEPDAIYALSETGVPVSVYLVDFGLDSRVAIPHGVARHVIKSGAEVSMCTVGDLVVLSVGELYVATPKSGVEYSEMPNGDILKGGWADASSDGVVSQDIILELDIAAMRDCLFFFMWTVGGSPGLHFYSPGDESGNNRGTVWSSIENFRFVGQTHLIRSLLQKSSMWRMRTVLFEDGDIPTLLVATEGGVWHYLRPVDPDAVVNPDYDPFHGPNFQKIIDEHDYKEQVDEGK